MRDGYTVSVPEYCASAAPRGREREDGICTFKSTGFAVQDLVAARAILTAARAAGAGRHVAIQEGAE